MEQPSQFSADTLRFVPYLVGTEAGFPPSITTLQEMGESFENGVTFNNKRDVYMIPYNFDNCEILLRFLVNLHRAMSDGISYGIYADLGKIHEHLDHLNTHIYLLRRYFETQN